jgi:maltooligosyltrehalose trehalohydrolase
MLFMGEEWAASTPWQFFASFPDPELADAVRSGRRREFGRHGWAEQDVPDPMDPATVERSRLDWAEPGEPWHNDMLGLYRELIALRKDRPELSDPRLDRFEVHGEDSWLVLHRGGLRLAVNLGAEPVTVPLGATAGATLLAGGEAGIDGALVRLGAESFVVLETLAR